MNVKITMTIPVESLPSKLKEMLLETSENLSDCSKELYFTSAELNTDCDLIKQLNCIDETRKNLAIADLKLEDTYNILKGYINLKSKNNFEEEGSKNVS